MMKYFLFFGVILFLVFTACKKDKTQTTEFDVECDEEISFNSDIIAIIASSCATSGCHNAASASSGYVFENHQQISSNADIILSVIRHEEGVVAMPIGAPKLSDEFAENFFCWIEQGKEDN